MRQLRYLAMIAIPVLAALFNCVLAGGPVFVVGGINLANHNETFLSDQSS